MAFDKREIILIAGILLFMVGLIPFMPPIYAMAIAIAIYFGIKVFVGRRKKKLEQQNDFDLCLKCGGKLIGNYCPKCMKSEK